MPEYNLLFVYGTLRPAVAPSRFPHGGAARAKGKMFDVSWFPGVKFGGEDDVIGDVIKVTTDELRSLDHYEGYNPHRPDSQYNLYVRVKIPVRLDTGEVVECWAYEYNRSTETLKPIPSGNFLDTKRM